MNESPALEREADVMGQRALLAGPVAASPPAVSATGATLSAAHSPVQAKRIMRANGRIAEVPDDYVVAEGERELREPTPSQLGHSQSSMRGALDPTGTDQTGGGKLAFGFDFFGHAFDAQPPTPVPITMKGGVTQTEQVTRPSPTTSASRLLQMLPGAMTKGGHLQQMLSTQDPSGHSSGGAQISIGQLREALAAWQYAQQQNLDPGSIHRPSAQVDFGGTQRGTGTPFLFDPFMSPQPLQPTKEQLAGQQLLQRSPDTTLPDKFQPRQEAAGKLAGRRRRWAADTYLRHTDETKGRGVVGLWDQTSDSAQDVADLRSTLRDANVPPGSVQPIDLQLDREYAREDFLARQQIAHTSDQRFVATGDSRHLRYLPSRQRLQRWRQLMDERSKRADARREREKERRRAEERRRRRNAPRQEALAWGNRLPDDPDDSPWGPNHPLYWRHGWRRGGGGGAAGAVAV